MLTIGLYLHQRQTKTSKEELNSTQLCAIKIIKPKTGTTCRNMSLTIAMFELRTDDNFAVHISQGHKGQLLTPPFVCLFHF
jgi:hypothetical protein